MSLETKEFYEFADFRLDLSEKLLLRAGKPVPLTPKVFDTLQILVENAGRLIEKDELMRRVWPDRFVEESNLTFNVKMLRKALGDNAARPRFIETVPKRGYRFIADARRGEIVEAEKTRPENNEGKINSPVNHPSPPLSFNTSHETKTTGAVIALADWRRPADEDESDETGADLPVKKDGAKTSKLELVPPLPLAADKRKNYLLAAAAAICAVALTAFGYGLYRLLGRPDSAADFRMSNVAQLTSNGQTKLAAVAPDGKFVAYITDDEGEQSLRLKNVATGSDAQILAPEENLSLGDLTFSPDGNYVFYSAKGTLYQLPILGGLPKKVLPNFGVGRGYNAISFSPDGKQFAFIRRSSGEGEEETAAVVVADADGAGERVLAASRLPDIFERSAVWSPDGKVIALVSGGTEKITAVRVADGAVSKIAAPPWSVVSQIVWRPGGDGLLAVATSTLR